MREFVGCPDLENEDTHQLKLINENKVQTRTPIIFSSWRSPITGIRDSHHLSENLLGVLILPDFDIDAGEAACGKETYR